jgi:hypothetical protein
MLQLRNKPIKMLLILVSINVFKLFVNGRRSSGPASFCPKYRTSVQRRTLFPLFDETFDL